MAVNGARVKSLREHRGWQVGQIAYKTGISKAHLYRIENNERPNVSADRLALLADILETSADYLLGRTNDPRPPSPAEPESDDPALLLQRQRIVEIVAALPPGRQQSVMEALAVLLEVESIADDAKEEDLLPQPRVVE